MSKEKINDINNTNSKQVLIFRKGGLDYYNKYKQDDDIVDDYKRKTNFKYYR